MWDKVSPWADSWDDPSAGRAMGTPAYMAPEQAREATALESDNLEPNAPVCDNCGHVHLHGDEWVKINDGVCAPDHMAPTVRSF